MRCVNLQGTFNQYVFFHYTDIIILFNQNTIFIIFRIFQSDIVWQIYIIQIVFIYGKMQLFPK